MFFLATMRYGCGKFCFSFSIFHSGMNKTSTFSRPIDYLNGQAHMEMLLKTARQYTAIMADCRRLQLPWFNQCRILRLENGVLFIGAPNQTMVARVRQNSSLLLHKLRGKGWKIDRIQLKVNFHRSPVNKKLSVRPRRLSEKARASFEALYRELEQDSDGSNLRDSLKKLLDRG